MASNMYIRFERPTIEPTSPMAGHEKEFEILSWSHAFNQPASPIPDRGGPVEQARHASLTVTRYVDAATSTLLRCCWTGQLLGQVTVTCYRSDGVASSTPAPYLTIAMQQVIVSNYSVANGPGDTALETVSLDYGIVQYGYGDPKQAGGGPVHVTHNLLDRTIS